MLVIRWFRRVQFDALLELAWSVHASRVKWVGSARGLFRDLRFLEESITVVNLWLYIEN